MGKDSVMARMFKSQPEGGGRSSTMSTPSWSEMPRDDSESLWMKASAKSL